MINIYLSSFLKGALLNPHYFEKFHARSQIVGENIVLNIYTNDELIANITSPIRNISNLLAIIDSLEIIGLNTLCDALISRYESFSYYIPISKIPIFLDMFSNLRADLKLKLTEILKK